MSFKSLAITTLLLSSLFGLKAQDLLLETFATGYTQPIGLENAGDHRLFVVEQKGIIQLIDTAGKKSTTPFLDITDRVLDRGNEQGLLGLAFHPNYKENGLFLVNYTKNGGTTVIALFETSDNPDIADVNSEKIVLEINQPYANHNGGGIVFGADGCLYIGMGDGGWAGDPERAGQDKQALLGKMLRIEIKEDGSYGVPTDNPFVGDASYLPEIWAMGVRNPWRFSFDPFNGDLWIADVGQDKWEEIDFQSGNSLGGENYGWRCREGANNYLPGDCPSSVVLTDPVYEYANNNSMGCSVTGGYVYRGSHNASVFGAYLFTDFCTGNIWRTDEKDGSFNTELIGKYKSNNYSSFGRDAAGELYLCERQTGNIVKLVTDECKPVAHFNGLSGDLTWEKGSTLSAGFGNGLSYEWFLDGTSLNQNTQEIVPQTAGVYRCIVKNLRGCADTAELTISGIVSTGTQKRELGEAQVFPNPAQQILNIRIPENWPSLENIQVVDLNGKKVLIEKATPYSQKELQLNVSSLPNGSYLLKFQAKSLEWVYPISVKH